MVPIRSINVIDCDQLKLIKVNKLISDATMVAFDSTAIRNC